MLRFGLEYVTSTDGDIKRVQFWRSLKTICNQSLDQLNGDVEGTLEIVALMKEADILSNKAMRETSQLINKLSELSTAQLTEFTMIFSSIEMQRAIDISQNIT